MSRAEGFQVLGAFRIQTEHFRKGWPGVEGGVVAQVASTMAVWITTAFPASAYRSWASGGIAGYKVSKERAVQ